MIGRSLSHYSILERIGAGGMGEVYRASDTTLGRDVALKLLPAEFARDPERVARFQREARTLASLHHPHIASIFGFEETGEHRFLVMEIVEGADLSQLLAQKPLGVDETVRMGLQIAEGLEAAHEKGIVHRDLKPANIKITPEGTAKILDFGLARAFMGDIENESDIHNSPTITGGMTMAGVILGTAAYMSPEQAKGKTVDKRSDIWAFGAVLYEMLTGMQAFPGETVSETLASVLKSDPEWSALPPDTPPALRRLMERCMERDHTRRLRDIGEARLILESIMAGERGVEDVVVAPARRAGALWIAVVAVVAVVATAGLMWVLRPGPEPLSTYRVEASVAGNLPLFSQQGSSVALSPDGNTMAFITGSITNTETFRLHIRALDRLEDTELVGIAYNPFFSPDGQWVGFVSPTELKKVSIAGGTPLTLCQLSLSRGATWGEQGTIVLAPTPGSGLVQVPASGGAPTELTTLGDGEASHRWPQFLPGGREVLFTSYTSADRNAGRIEVLDLDTKKRTLVHQGGTYARYAASGHLLFVNNGTLFAAPFDLGSLSMKALPSPVLQDVSMNTEGGAVYDVSRSGNLVYLTGKLAGAKNLLTWADAQGRLSHVTEVARQYGVMRLSPDDSRLAVEVTTDGNRDIWVYDLVRNTQTRLTFEDGAEINPVWSPDGSTIYYAAGPNQRYGIYSKRADGSGQTTLVSDSLGEFIVNPYCVSPDGKFLAYHDQSPDGDIWLLPLDGSRVPRRFFSSPNAEGDPMFSPDGRWILYDADDSGQWEVYVRPFPGPGGKWQISTEGGEFARWSDDGKKLFYLDRNGGVWSVSVSYSADSFNAGRPEKLFELPLALRGNEWEVSHDGTRFMLIQQGTLSDEGVANHVKFAFHWFGELERLLAATR